MMRKALWATILTLAGLAGLEGGEATRTAASTPEVSWQKLRSRLPATPREPVADTYFGTRVLDPYRWLEDGADARVRNWMKQQDQVARAFLDHIPGEDPLERRIREILSAKTVRWSGPREAGGALFVMKTQPPRQQPFLVVASGLDAVEEARTVVDPNRLDLEGHTAIDWFRPSPDGKLVAVSLSRLGTEAGDLHIFDVASGEERFEVIPRVQRGTAGGDACWTPDGAGVYYTRYPREGEREGQELNFHQQLWLHRFGTPVTSDRYELGRDFPRTAEIRVQLSQATGRVLALVQEGDSGRFQHYLRGPDGHWAQLTTYADKITGAEFGPDGALYLISLKGAPRGKILVLPRNARTLAEATLAVDEQEGALQWDFYFGNTFVPTADQLYASYQVGGPTELRTFGLPSGEPVGGPSVPPVSSVGQLRALSGRRLLFRRSSYTDPPAWYVYDPATGQAHPSAMRSSSPVSFGDTTVERHFATSRDGTKVPFVVLMKKGTTLDGDNPVLATAYGGYGIARVPAFDPTLRVWLDRGGVFVEAGVRGGDEYGEEWHRQGSGLLKQNTFDDFAAVLRWLTENRYTRPERLGIIGGSNGGILMGAMITQHPEMERVVVSSVGIYDMLRSELTPNGQFNVPEYGSVTNEAQFRVLYSYSPYHHVAAGTPYPAVLLTAGANDPRVDPRDSRKFAAALQAATTSGEPVLLRVDYRAGHGLDASLDQRIESEVHVYAFLMHFLGMLDGAQALREPPPPAR